MMSNKLPPEKFRQRNFRMLLWCDNESHCACIEKIKSEQFRYVAILHDKDTDEDGNPKKAHWHVVLCFAHARWNTAVAELLGIEKKWIYPADNLDGAILYLVHGGSDDADKYQYDPSEAFGELTIKLNKLLIPTDEGERVLQLVELLDSHAGEVTYREMLVKACKNGLYGEFRRLGAGAKFLIDEHNKEVNDNIQRNAGVMVSKEAFDEYLRWTGTNHSNVKWGL